MKISDSYLICAFGETLWNVPQCGSGMILSCLSANQIDFFRIPFKFKQIQNQYKLIDRPVMIEYKQKKLTLPRNPVLFQRNYLESKLKRLLLSPYENAH